MLGDALVDVLLARHNEADFLRKGERDLVGDAGIHEIGGGQRDAADIRPHADHVVHTCDRCGNGVDDIVIQLHVRKIDDLAPLIGRHHAEERILVEIAAVDNDFPSGLSAGIYLFLPDRLNAVLVKDTVLDEEIEQWVKLCCHLATPHFFLKLRDNRVGILRLRDELVVGDVAMPIMVQQARVERDHTELRTGLDV